MTKKQICIILMSSLLANGVIAASNTKHSSPMSVYTPNLYIEGAAGYTFCDWGTSLNQVFQPLVASPGTTVINTHSIKHHNGFAGGGDIGYQFNRNLALEFGAFGSQKVSYDYFNQSTTGSDVTSSRNKGSITNWFLFAAAKINLPLKVIRHLDIFGKFGGAFRYGKISNTTYSFDSTLPEAPTSKVSLNSGISSFSALVGGGLEYRITKNWTINVQYLFLPAPVSSTTTIADFDHFRFPIMNIITGGISYNFPLKGKS